MDISNLVLTPDLISHGYSADENTRDSIVTLKYHGESVKEFFGCKDKVIRGAAFMHDLQTHSHFNDCQQAMESGGLLI